MPRHSPRRCPSKGRFTPNQERREDGFWLYWFSRHRETNLRLELLSRRSRRRGLHATWHFRDSKLIPPPPFPPLAKLLQGYSPKVLPHKTKPGWSFGSAGRATWPGQCQKYSLPSSTPCHKDWAGIRHLWPEIPAASSAAPGQYPAQARVVIAKPMQSISKRILR